MILLRKYFGSTYTIGALHIKNPDTGELKYFCDTLEPHAIDWSKERGICKNKKAATRLSLSCCDFLALSHKDSNLIKQNQNLLCYHYTIGQS